MQTFDRSSFGVGNLATNRYQPTDAVGDSRDPGSGFGGGLPASASREHLQAGGGSAPPPLSGQQQAGGGRTGGGGGRAAGGALSSQAAGGAFMPFAMPTYAIPTLDGRGKVRTLHSGWDGLVLTRRLLVTNSTVMMPPPSGLTGS